VNADRFAVLPQGAPKSDAVAPFIVHNGEVYINTARIWEGTIQKGQIGAIGFGQIVDESDLPVTTVAGKLKGDLIEAENLKVAEAATFSGDAKSSNYDPGYAGWIIKQSGYVEFNNAQIRGNVDLDSLTVNGELPEAGDTLEAAPQSYDAAFGSTGLNKTLSFYDNTTFDKVPKDAPLTIDYLFDGEVQLDLASAGEIVYDDHYLSYSGYYDYNDPRPELPLHDESETYWFYEQLQDDGTYKTVPIPRNTGYETEEGEEDPDAGVDGYLTGWKRGYYYWGGKDEDRYTEFRGTVTINFEVKVDGVVVFSDSQSQAISYDLQSAWSGTTSSQGTLTRETASPSIRLLVPLNTLRYNYPEYREQSLVEVTASVSVSGIKFNESQPPSTGRYIRMDMRDAGVSLELSRL